MNMRDIIRLLENVIVEHQRVAVWSGATITVLHNPTKLTFEKFIQKYPSLRGLLSEDGTQVWLWPAYMAVHPNIIQELGLDRCECIFWNRGRWAGPNIHDSNGLYKPALQRLSPASPAHYDVSDDELMNLLKEDSNNIPFHMPESIEVDFVGYFDPDAKIAHIGSIISKKRGEGGKAVRVFEAWAKEQGAKRIEGSARPDSLLFWNKMGFKDRSRGESLIPIWKTIW
jgi:hypothetical protein